MIPMVKAKKCKGVKVKGICMTKKEYKHFVENLNRYDVQKFTREDVEEFLVYHRQHNLEHPFLYY